MQDEIKNINRELLELKTAKEIPAYINMYSGTVTRAAGIYNGIYRWRIYFQDVGDTEPPIVSGASSLFSKYDAINNTIDLFEDFSGWQAMTWPTAESYQIRSTRPIIRIDQIDAPLQHEWEQVRDFYPADMGSTPGWCLQNTRLGFHIYSGTYASARADMESQEANGTLHSGTPPDYIAVPIYFKNYWWTLDGHVAAWDHGRIYSDGVEYPSIDSVATDYAGWGELCDGARVVQHV